MRESTIDVGGIRVLLRASDPNFWRCADARYAKFYVSPTRIPDETIDNVVSLDGKKSHEGPPTVIEKNGIIQLWHASALGEWNPRYHTARIIGAPVEGDHAEAAADSLLRVILSFRFLPVHTLLAHGAGMLRGREGYLFLGPSGAGKSTAARASLSVASVLSDELTVAGLSDAGPFVQSTPFYGELGNVNVNCAGPLKALYFLTKSRVNGVVPISNKDAFQRLMRCIMFFGDSAEHIHALMALAQAFCREIPCYELKFLKDSSFWELIDGTTPSKPSRC